MSTPLEVLDQRIRELCEAIVAQDGFSELYRKTDAFLRDEGAKYQFSILNDVGGYLQQKQALGAELTEEEVGHYEGLRKAALEKAVIVEFAEAQRGVQSIQDRILRMVGKTFEVGRVPVDDDFSDETCQTCGNH
jgi:cell fate (sporulation/competence/biofilm development) regulator YlbF (YheA/YmcA/DUF963 family)